MENVKCKMALLLIMSLFLFSGCIGDRVYHSKYQISFKRNMNGTVLCSESEPNDVLQFVDMNVKYNSFEGLKAVDTISSSNTYTKNYAIKTASWSYGDFHVVQDREGIFLEFFSWNPGMYEGEGIKKTKIYEKDLIEKLKQEECIELEKID